MGASLTTGLAPISPDQPVGCLSSLDDESKWRVWDSNPQACKISKVVPSKMRPRRKAGVLFELVPNTSAHSNEHTPHDDPEGIRTPDLPLRRQPLYPTELRDRTNYQMPREGIEPPIEVCKTPVFPLNYPGVGLANLISTDLTLCLQRPD